MSRRAGRLELRAAARRGTSEGSGWAPQPGESEGSAFDPDEEVGLDDLDTFSLDDTAEHADGMKGTPRRQLISRAEARPCTGQPKRPCPDCPMTRASLPGWLGGATPEEYLRLAHSDVLVDCHTLIGPQCAGMAIYRANVAKRCDPPNLTLPNDREACFATPHEFLAHHSKKG